MLEVFILVFLVLLQWNVLKMRKRVEEMSRLLQEYRREQLRENFGGRTSRKQEGQVEEPYWEEEDIALKEEKKEKNLLKMEEEQVVKEVLAEFFG